MFNEELKYVWSAQISLQKVAYLSCRYVSVPTLWIIVYGPSPMATGNFQFCSVWLWTATVWMVVTTLIPGNMLLCMRLHSLYGKDPYIRIILLIVFAVEEIGHIVVLAVFASDIEFLSGIPKGTGLSLGCVAKQSGGRVLAIMTAAPELVLLCIYMVLAFKIFIFHVAERANMRSLRVIRNAQLLSSSVPLLFRDGALIYVIILAATILNLSMLSLAFNRSLQAAGVPWLVCIYAIACPRLLLMLKGDVSNATGVYKAGTDSLHVNPSQGSSYELMGSISNVESRTEVDSVGKRAHSLKHGYNIGQ